MVDVSVKTEFYVATGSPPLEERVRVLKYGPMFAVFDRFGDIRTSGLGEHGIYFRGTRYLSRLNLFFGSTQPLFLSSGVRADNALFSADLTNVDLISDDTVVLGRGTIHVVRSRLLKDGTCYEQMRLTNYGPTTVRLPVRIEFATDFADIFEVRGVTRPRRGELLPEVIGHDHVTLSYIGLDNVKRSTRLQCSPAPSEVSESRIMIETELPPRETAKIQLVIECGENLSPQADTFDNALAAVVAELAEKQSACCAIRSSNNQFNNWLNRSLSDVHMMTVGNPETNYPYAGVPWFSTVFGRDGIITALQCLWFDPSVARGVLGYLAANQADTENPEQDAQPGKILHEFREDEMATLGEIPFRRYYGSIDATPLFVMLAGAYYKRTGDRAFIESIWPNVQRALGWIDRYGDSDGDGFVEYTRRSRHGLVHQGWKDSHDAIFHRDGAPAEGPIALCEVQGYVYAARSAASELARILGDAARARELSKQAESLSRRFEKAFWCDDLSTYALALDGNKQTCRVRTSNAGHCLFTGIATPEHARRVVATLTDETSFSGWGIRTVASSEARYNPMSYHNGSVWPHDNSLIAAGFARYGLKESAAMVLAGLLDASLFFDLHRLPELFCGFPRRPGESPTLYPVACAPQAWASAAIFLLLEACLGLSVSAPEQTLVFSKPILPAFLPKVSIRGLKVGDARVDLLLTRHDEGDVGVNVLRRDSELDVIVLK